MLQIQPLDKVCFIGKSGTGKTSILRLIKLLITRDAKVGINVYLPTPEKESLKGFISFEEMEFCRQFGLEEDGKFKTYISDTTQAGEVIEISEFIKIRNQYETSINPLLVNYPTEILSSDRSLLFELDSAEKEVYIKEKEEYLDKLSPDKVIDFAISDASISWDYVLKKIKSHAAQEIILKNKIADIALNKKSSPKQLQEVNSNYQEWIKNNPNPLENLANELLNNVLKNLGLKVKLDFDYESVLNLGAIELQTLSGVDVPRTFWSTGTKHLIDTLIPLYELELKNAVILMDEPERSLYPDIQSTIIDTYISLAKNCQFFFATHSPIIASSFDPWEIVELVFDDNNLFVLQSMHYQGDRHVDNYEFYPKYLRWDGILMRLFDLQNEGNNNFREMTLTKAIGLKKQLEKMQTDGKQKTTLFKKKQIEYIDLAKKLGWDL